MIFTRLRLRIYILCLYCIVCYNKLDIGGKQSIWCTSTKKKRRRSNSFHGMILGIMLWAIEMKSQSNHGNIIIATLPRKNVPCRLSIMAILELVGLNNRKVTRWVSIIVCYHPYPSSPVTFGGVSYDTFKGALPQYRLPPYRLFKSMRWIEISIGFQIYLQLILQ